MSKCALMHPPYGRCKNACGALSLQLKVEKHMEGYIYKTLLHQKQSRLFLASADPTGDLPILSDILIDVDQANKLTWTHNLSLHNIFIDHTIQDYNHSTVTNLTNVPLFSTYDAPNGFIWTRIDSTGNISVYDGTSFQRVL